MNGGGDGKPNGGRDGFVFEEEGDGENEKDSGCAGLEHLA